MKDCYPVDVTCRCGARLKTYRWLASEANIAVKQFHAAHRACRASPYEVRINYEPHRLQSTGN